MEIHTDTTEILDKIATTALKQEPGTIMNDKVTVVPVPAALIDKTFTGTTNLSTSVLGASIVSFSDEYFAGAANLLTPTAPIRKAGYFVHTGAWFDGWETRRHNQAPFDWVIIKLGCVGVIDGIEVDTAYFNGNEAPEAGLDGVYAPDVSDEEIGKEGFSGWEEVLPKQRCGPSQRQAWKVSGRAVNGKEWTHLRLKQFPDGGIARLKVYGKVVPPALPAGTQAADRPLEDLASALNGGVAVEFSDQHFGVVSNLLLPGRGKDMGDGWETARSRKPGHVDWVIAKLGLKGKSIEKIIVDTKDFRGNFPRAVRVEGWPMEPAKAALGTEQTPKFDSPGWVPLINGDQPCQADHEHIFEGDSLVASVPLQDWVWTHVKMTIIPDGGVKRIKVFGKRA